MATSGLGKILIIDRDLHITTLLRCNLRDEGYDVDVQPDAAEAMRNDLSDVRVVILDAFGQNGGIEALNELASSHRTAHIGVIVCSAGETPGEAITALDAGADDYIVKPFSLREIIARVRAVMRRRRPPMTPPAHTDGIFGPLRIDFTTRTALLDGTPISLTPTEYAILVMLLKNRDRHLSRQEIFRSIWKDPTAGSNDRVVDTNISRLRRKLGTFGASIQNHSGSGYIIV